MATQITTTCKIGDESKTKTVEYDFGENLEEMVEKFGEDVVYAQSKKSMILGVQGLVRGRMKKGQDDTIDEAVANHVPGVPTERTPADPKAKALAAFAKMDDDTKAAFLDAIRNG